MNDVEQDSNAELCLAELYSTVHLVKRNIWVIDCYEEGWQQSMPALWSVVEYF